MHTRKAQEAQWLCAVRTEAPTKMWKSQCLRTTVSVGHCHAHVQGIMCQLVAGMDEFPRDLRFPSLAAFRPSPALLLCLKLRIPRPPHPGL